ncbi:ATP-binding protein [Cohnella yongneupensis]|uniref:histidine kinase n=1 Tax=Cohnella yongneupensis TaxID=425006 RepID=A0ABW0QVI8_9BACL
MPRKSRAPLILLFIGLVLLAAYFLWPGTWHKTLFSGLVSSNILQTAGAMYATVTLLLAYRTSNKEKLFLKYYGYGMLVHTAAQLGWTYGIIARNSEPDFIGIPETLWDTQYIFFVMALYVQYNHRIRTQRFSLGFPLDIVLYSTAAATLYWELQIEPLLSEHNFYGGIVWFSLLNSSFNVVILLLLIFLGLNGRRALSLPADLLLIAGFLVRQIGNTTYLYLLPSTEAGSAWSWISDMSWFIGSMLIGFAALAETRRKPRPRRKIPASGTSRFIQRYATTILVSIALIAIISMLGKFSPVTVGAIVTIVLLTVRLSIGIKELESADVALQQTGMNYRNLVENSLIGVFIEQEGRLVYVNRHAERIFGCEIGEMLGKPLADYIVTADRERLGKEFFACGSYDHSVRFGVTAKNRAGEDIYLELQASSAYHRGEPAISGTLLDVTDSKLSEQRLIRSEKLSVIGQLAAGVAHEIRNPLTALKGFTQLLHKSADRNRNYYEMMLTELERINYIVGEFVLLSKPNQWQRLVPCDMSRMLGDIVPIMQSQAIITNVTIQVEDDGQLPNVMCDVNQIKQVLINLMKNAIEAMPGGGMLDVRAREDNSGHVVIEVQDQGVGIPEEVIARLGEPFYTTKQSGTGLGLTVCFKIIQAHGGMLTLSSKPNEGTLAVVTLPVAK